ncbi:MAG: tRNA (N6-threonylcarbamoyladenosine(37)-N6)-methyltransferase TrmO [Hyphomicrobiales bacterium]|nr:MAG: tRNA (N6-threonylcarbamoyladenosine(37)-N6)-methyltransferase TrmO [Hyphomicrobiales bacterium]
MTDPARPGEITLDFDPAELTPDAGVVFIGRVRTPWSERKDCPRNTETSLASGTTQTLEIDEPYRPGLQGLDEASHLFVLYWMHHARRDLIVQTPNHKPGLRGVFSLRSPVRPNPIALARVEILNLDIDAGRIEIRGIDCLDGTPIVDVKPWFASNDSAFADK